MSSLLFQPVERARARRPYRVTASPTPDLLRLDGNEAAGAPDRLRDLLTAARLPVLSRYPNGAELEGALAARFGLEAEQCLVTAGADEALDRAARVALEPGRRCVLASPGFEMSERYAELAGAELVRTPWESDAFPRAELERDARSASLLVVASPNNPTGRVAPASELVALARSLPRTLCVYDLAYVEYAAQDPTRALLQEPNVLVMRTLSKAWGLAGLRVGYALGPSTVIDWMRASAGPFPVSSLSLALACAALEGGEEVPRAARAQVAQEREQLSDALRSVGGRPSPSEGNFAFARFGSAQRAAEVARALEQGGVRVRAFGQRPGLEDALRITCPQDAATTRRVLELFASLSEGLEVAS